MKNHFNPPTVDDVRRIANSFLSQGELRIQRLPTGLCHYVFDVQGKQQRFVIRICHPDNTSYLNGNLFWSTQLQKLSLPIPQIFKLSIEEQKYSFMILEYIDGVDLAVKLEETKGPLPEKQVLEWGEQVAQVPSSARWSSVVSARRAASRRRSMPSTYEEGDSSGSEEPAMLRNSSCLTQRKLLFAFAQERRENREHQDQLRHRLPQRTREHEC